MARQLYVAAIIEYKNETMEYLLRLQAWLVSYWRWVNYAAESTNPTFPHTAPKLSHVNFNFSQSGPFHKSLDIEQYCFISWGTANNSVLQRLSVLQNNILRIMTFTKYRCHLTPLYKNLKILKMNDIYQFELAKFMHKFHHGKLPEIYKEYFQETSSVHSYQTRFANMENYFTHRVSSNAGKKSISCRGVSLWNKVELNLKAVPLSTFCNQLRVCILTVLSKQNKFNFHWLLLNFMRYCFHFLCLFLRNSFYVLERVSFCYITIHILVLRHFTGHLDQITLGFVDVRASEKNAYMK